MRLHLIDGTFELYRAHYSKRPDTTTPDGQPFKGVAGLASSLLTLLGDVVEDVTHAAIAFDNPIRSFRNDLFDGYKSDAGVPPEIRAQFGPAEAAARALGITVWSMDRWEADDALATAAVRWADDVDQVRILTPDKDLGQVVRGQRIVQVDRIRDLEIDEDEVVARRGVPPASLADWLALVGDKADGIPGLPGWGAKSASTLLARYGHLDQIPTDPDAWDVKVRSAAKLAATLAAHRDEALLYRRLATLITDVPLPQSLDDLAWPGPSLDDFSVWAEDHGVGRLVGRVPRWA